MRVQVVPRAQFSWRMLQQTKSIAEVIVMKESFLLLFSFAESFTGGDTTSWENERSALKIIWKCPSNLPPNTRKVQ